MNNQTVKNAILYKEENGISGMEEYFLDVTLLIEDDRYIKEVHVPKIRLPLYRAYVERFLEGPEQRAQFIMPARYLDIYPHDDGHLFTEKIVEEKVYEMTLSEIQSKLGYKIKIVPEKGECE